MLDYWNEEIKEKVESNKLGKNYNKIAEWWTGQMKGSDYGMPYARKAMRHVKPNSKMLDIGCGSNSRMIEEALKNDFDVTGIDVSSEMIRIAQKLHPNVNFI